MCTQGDEDDIVAKYLPIFLSLKQEAVQEVRDSLGVGQSKQEQENDQSLSDAASDLFDDDIPDSVFAEIPDVEDDFPSIVTFPFNSHLHKRRQRAEKRAQFLIPNLLIRDVLQSLPWVISSTSDSTRLVCDNLYQIGQLVYNRVVIRGTVIGVNLQSSSMILDDGTDTMTFYLDEEAFENAPKVPTGLIRGFAVDDLEAVTSPYALHRGDVVQIRGCLREYFGEKRVYVNGIVKESGVCPVREKSYIDYIRRLYKTYKEWKHTY